MACYADQIAELPLYQELKVSAGRDRMSDTDLAILTAMVCQIADHVGPLLDRVPQTFPQYTDHGFTHARNVIDLTGRFIPRDTVSKLNGVEIAMLLLAAILHDIGMFVSDQEKRQALESDSFATFATLHPDREAAIRRARSAGDHRRALAIEDSLLAEYFRRVHPQRARQFIQRHFADKLTFREVDLSDDIGILCESHAWGVRETNDSQYPDNAVIRLPTKKPVSSFPANMQYLACCLRLADIMDFDRSRTPLSVFQHIDFTEPKSWNEWLKHLQVTGWTIDEREVLYAFACAHPAFYVAVHEFLDAVDAELRDCRYLIHEAPPKIAKRYNLNLPPIADRRQVTMKDKQYVAGAFRFQLEYDDIMRLLMDKSLYPDPSLFLRELLQNALDACRHKEALWQEKGKPAPYKPRIVVWDHSDDGDDPRIVFQDNGMGMSFEIVENYFMRIGKSYYRSPQFEAERQRLESKRVSLEACSIFGIGILSCFLVADRFEVETYRFDHQPLHITVEGPSKYFVIKRFPKPELQEFTTPPRSDADDGPPQRTGTRVTVHLRANTTVDAHQVLKLFAANLEYEVRAYPPRRSRPILIKAHAWGRVLRLTDHPGFLPVARSQPHPDAWKRAASNLQQVVESSVVPFSEWDFSRDLRGTAWFWLLSDGHGDVCPERGYLILQPRGIGLTGLAHFVPDLARYGWATNDWQATTAKLKRAADSAQWPFPHEQNPLLIAQWQQLSPEERDCAWHVWERQNAAEKLPWYLEEALTRSFADRTLDWVNWSSPVFLDGCFIARCEGLALHGIRVPEGTVAADPSTSRSFPLPMFPVCGGCRVDARGHCAPRPAAHRMSIDASDAWQVAVPLARAAVRHALNLVLAHHCTDPWRSWLRRVLDDVATPFFGMRPYVQAAVCWEVLRLEDILGYEVSLGQGTETLSRTEIVERFGNWVPFTDDPSLKPGLWQTFSNAQELMLSAREQREHSDGTRYVHLGGHPKDPAVRVVPDATALWHADRAFALLAFPAP